MLAVHLNIKTMRTHTHLLLALVLLFGAKVFGQEWEYTIDYIELAYGRMEIGGHRP